MKVKGIKKYTTLLLSGLAILGLAVGVTLALPGSALAASTLDQDVPARERGNPPGDRLPGQDGDSTYLADALGIPIEELEAAQKAAGEAALQQAVDEGLLTEEQAEALKNNDRSGRPPFPGKPQGPGNEVIDHEALLANALGITVEDLQAAQKAAGDARLEQAIADGKITQEQVDMMKARQAFGEYLHETGVIETAIEGAVEEGVITQEQADAFLSKLGEGRGGFFGGRTGSMRGGPSMNRGHRGMGEVPGGAEGSPAPQGRPARPAAPNSTGA
jgi:hypothetical protein